jgi:hypothetical protein
MITLPRVVYKPHNSQDSIKKGCIPICGRGV